MTMLSDEYQRFLDVEADLAEEDGRVVDLPVSPIVGALNRLTQSLRLVSTDGVSGISTLLRDGDHGLTIEAEDGKWTPEERQIGEAQALTRELRNRRQRRSRK
jgi:hypothetical protein